MRVKLTQAAVIIFTLGCQLNHFLSQLVTIIIQLLERIHLRKWSHLKDGNGVTADAKP